MAWTFKYQEQYIVPASPVAVGHPDFWPDGPATSYVTSVEEIDDSYWETVDVYGPSAVVILAIHQHRPGGGDDPDDYISFDITIESGRILQAVTKREKDGIVSPWINLRCDLNQAPWHRVLVSGVEESSNWALASYDYEVPKSYFLQYEEGKNEVYIFLKMFGRADGAALPRWLPKPLDGILPPIHQPCPI